LSFFMILFFSPTNKIGPKQINFSYFYLQFYLSFAKFPIFFIYHYLIITIHWINPLLFHNWFFCKIPMYPNVEHQVWIIVMKSKGD
jgi:hypothetical protein